MFKALSLKSTVGSRTTTIHLPVPSRPGPGLSARREADVSRYWRKLGLYNCEEEYIFDIPSKILNNIPGTQSQGFFKINSQQNSPLPSPCNFDSRRLANKIRSFSTQLRPCLNTTLFSSSIPKFQKSRKIERSP